MSAVKTNVYLFFSGHFNRRSTPMGGFQLRLPRLRRARPACYASRSRTSDEKRAAELAALLEFWLVRGKPRREPRLEEKSP
jgi:hypothetical protein